MAAAVPRVMAPAAALVAPIVRVEAATLAARGTSPATVTTTAISAAQTPATLAGGQLDARPAPTDRPAVQPPDGILRVARVLELDEGEARRIAGHPNVPQRTVIREGILDFLLASVVSQLPDVNLGIMRVARHLLRHFVVPTTKKMNFFPLSSELQLPLRRFPALYGRLATSR